VTVVEPTREYGYRDLGIIQDLRRQYLDLAFGYHTNDLMLAARVYNLRHQCGTDANISAELDRVFTNVVNGNLNAANLQLTEIESKPRRRESTKNPWFRVIAGSCGVRASLTTACNPRP